MILTTRRSLARALLLAALVLGSCSDSARPRTLTVFAAASLADAFAEIGQAFEAAHPDVTVRFNFAGSQNLRSQLEQGAAADVFASANQKEMDAAIAQSLVEPADARPFVTNELVVILPGDNPAGIDALEDLARPGIKLVLAAEEVPVGLYSRTVLENLQTRYGADFKARVLANLVSSEDNVRQVLAKVQLGEADAGIVYASDARASKDVVTIEIPAEFNVIAEYPIAVLRSAPDPELARAFVDLVLSSDGQAALARWGFHPAAP